MLIPDCEMLMLDFLLLLSDSLERRHRVSTVSLEKTKIVGALPPLEI